MAMHGRSRTTITSFGFLEKRFGWRLRLDTLKHFSMSEIILTDAFAPISMKFITDVCQFLSTERNLSDADFFDMGLHSYIGNKDSILGNTLSKLPNVKAILEHMWGDLLPLLEQNCHYKFYS